MSLLPKEVALKMIHTILTSNKKRKILVIGSIVLAVIVIGWVILGSKMMNYKKIDNTTKLSAAIKKSNSYKYDLWLDVIGTNINYPVISYNAALQLNKQNSGFYDTTIIKNNVQINDDIPSYVVIQGHNLLNLSSEPDITRSGHKRFEQLMSFYYQSFLANNQYFILSTTKENNIYKIFAVFFVEYNSFLIDGYNATVNNTQILTEVQARNMFDMKVDVTSKDKLVALITCTRKYNGRRDIAFVVMGRQLRPNEPIKKAKVIARDTFVEPENQ